MLKTHTLGFPRIGAQRELKVALELHWGGQLSEADLDQRVEGLLHERWRQQLAHGLDFLTVFDFAHYDHVARHIQLFGCEPARFERGQQSPLATHFAMARGGGVGRERVPLEMTKWFDTNYHYLVPEYDETTEFTLNAASLLAEITQAQRYDKPIKPVLLGPLTLLWLGKSKQPGFDVFSLLPKLLPCYRGLLRLLTARGIDWVQLDEPILGLELPPQVRTAFTPTYAALAEDARILLSTYFSKLGDQLALACSLPVAGLHVDAVRAPEELLEVHRALPRNKVLSVGIIDGRNVWRTDLDAALERLRPLYPQREDVWLAPSCSLLHVPVSLAADKGVDERIRPWLAGAVEKLQELAILRKALAPAAARTELFAESRRVVVERRESALSRNSEVRQRVELLPRDCDRRRSAFATREALQRKRLGLPPLPTTTIGSFPQTQQVRAARAAFKRGGLTEEQYLETMRQEVALAVREQEALGLDVLVHGEPERNDMVEYFGERLTGFTVSADGWVQSYGSRCVKPPILYGDVSRPEPMTVTWARYAASLTHKPMKGMLTGPITILQWSFVRDDQPRSVTALQLALAIRDEVVDLEQAGIPIIQIDEPALREGLPLRRAAWDEYLTWATRAFRIAASGVADATQIHTHMCYAEFNDILPQIAALDADVITIETSRSDMELLRGFGEFAYPNHIGPGVWDIHSPRVPSQQEMLRLLEKAAEVIPIEHLWINPDCGLKTRGWPETRAGLQQMVDAARTLRARVAASG